MSQPEAPFIYSEDHGGVHPKAELHLGPEDIEVVHETMDRIAACREVPSGESPKEIFAGMTTGEEHGGLLVVVDVHHPGTHDFQYIVRSARIGQGTPEILEERALHPEHVRSPIQPIQTRSLGSMRVGSGPPDDRFDRSRDTDGITPFAAIGGKRLVSLRDAFSEYTDNERLQLALDAVDPTKHSSRYPNIDRTPLEGDNPLRQTRLEVVERALYPISQLLRREQHAGDRWNPGVERTMDAADRARLVCMAHKIMMIANADPQSVTVGHVLNSEEAFYMALAEDEVRNGQKSDGLFGRRRIQNLRARDQAATHASLTYSQDLHRSMGRSQPET